ncbi:hypothetical protein LHJ74_20075 [Streptomyces sp. N2-109]|uniref:ATPase n=1 Tax=Streptomyces gossypii TaxID=2883101 RepID=A0ABT2JXJ4_9ACTN|nr:hypothetical protein [Streptomyces gossypii]MCT2592174.1 hypothetical protein [Streptomyces gossypii]
MAARNSPTPAPGGGQQDWQRDVLRDLSSPATGGAPGATGAPGAPSAPSAPSAANPVGAAASPPPQPRPSSPLPPLPPSPPAHTSSPPAHASSPPRLPLPSPLSVPLVTPELAAAEGRSRHGDTLARRTARALRSLVASAARDTAAVTEAARAIQQPVTTGRQIAVTSIRGGSGKSTVAALLGLTYAHYRPDPVLAVEADPALGTLPRRLGATEVRWSVPDLARIVDPSMRITDLTGYLLPFEGGGWLLPGSQGSVGAQIDVGTYRTVMAAVRRYFGTTVVDCESLPAEVARTALVTGQARVLTTPATVEGVAATRTVLDWLGKVHRSMLPTTVVALVRTSPDAALDQARAVAQLETGGAAVTVLPYDRHLAAGGAVRTELLGRATREAAALLAAAVMDRAVSRERAPAGQAPAGQAPAGQAPAGQARAGQAPAGRAPGGPTQPFAGERAR